jgi:RNA polymerase sigma-70 factor (ECF subfamily)
MSEPKADETPDETLVARAVANPGEPEGRAAAEELFRRYHGRVYVWCFQRVRDHERALDLAQDALLSACRALGTFEGRSRFSSWLFSIARNRCLSELRAPSLTRDEGVDPDALEDRGPGLAADVEERLEEEATLQLIRETLEPVEQRALWLRCFERMSVEDVTRVLGITHVSGARAVLQTARRKLRAALERRAAEPGRHS